MLFMSVDSYNGRGAVDTLHINFIHCMYWRKRYLLHTNVINRDRRGGTDFVNCDTLSHLVLDSTILFTLVPMDQTLAKKELQELIKRDDLKNKTCIDCGNPNPQWASLRYAMFHHQSDILGALMAPYWSFAVFLWLQCAGTHRGFGVHIRCILRLHLADKCLTQPQFCTFSFDGYVAGRTDTADEGIALSGHILGCHWRRWSWVEIYPSVRSCKLIRLLIRVDIRTGWALTKLITVGLLLSIKKR